MADAPENFKDDSAQPTYQVDRNADPDFDIDDEAVIDPIGGNASALPVLLDDDEDYENYDLRRKPIVLDLDRGSQSSNMSSTLDLSALIGQFDAAKRASSKPQPTETTTAKDQVFDVSTPAASQNAEVARLRSELEEERNNVRRARADVINLRRKSEQDRERAVRDSSERVIKQLLAIMDDFERGLSATSQTRSYEQLSDGVEAILRNFTTLLNKQGIEQIQTLGSMFDPDLHEAVATDETSEEPEDTIVEELRKGYVSEGRLLRAALVRVAKRSALPAIIEDSTQPDPDSETDASAEQTSP